MVYLDPLRDGAGSGRAARTCRLMADQLEELHTFAKAMGCRREWFRGEPVPHYPLTAGMRQRAVGFRAKQLDLEQAADLDRRWRQRLAAGLDAQATEPRGAG